MFLMTQNIGIIGLGSIGLPIAQNIMGKGFAVHGYRRSTMSAFAAAGGRPASSPKVLAETCDVIVTVLPDLAAVEEAICGQNGILVAGRKGLTIIELSTLPLSGKTALAEKLAAAGCTMMDCPISGVPQMIADRNGILFVSGDKAVFEREKSVFEAISDKVFYLGKFGDGTKMKFIANSLVSIHILAAAEALALGVKAGLGRDLMVKVLSPSAATSLQFQVRAPLMMQKKYEPVLAATSILSHDVPMFTQFADELGCEVPLLRVCEDYYKRALGTPWADKDVAAIIEIVAKANGMEI